MVQTRAVLKHAVAEMINMFEKYAELAEREGCPLGTPGQVNPGETCTC